MKEYLASDDPVPVNSTNRNIAANLAFSVWGFMVSLVAVPVYIRFVGIEAWGIMGIYATLMTAARLLDLGISTTLNRELASQSATQGCADETRNLVRTLEVLYWGIAFLLGAVVTAIVPFLASDWVHTVNLAHGTVSRALALVAIVIVFQWPFNLYSGGLLGLQRQVALALVSAFMTTLRAVGAILVLWLVSPTIDAFLYWQIAISILSTLCVAVLLWRSLPGGWRGARMRPVLLKKVWRFTLGMGVAGALGLVLTQLDRLILSKMLPLDKFGYYALAGTLVGGLQYVTASIHAAIFPRFTHLVASGDEVRLASAYHEAGEIVAVLVVPAVVVLALFSCETIEVWTGSSVAVENVGHVVSLLAIGVGLSGLTITSYALQLAHGWTRLSLYLNAGQLVITAPAIVFLTQRYGLVGAALSWVITGMVLLVLQPWLTHRKILKGELCRWCLQDTARPLAAALAVGLLGRVLMPSNGSRGMLGLYVVLISVATECAACLSSNVVRGRILERLGWRNGVSAPPAS